MSYQEIQMLIIAIIALTSAIILIITGLACYYQNSGKPFGWLILCILLTPVGAITLALIIYVVDKSRK